MVFSGLPFLLTFGGLASKVETISPTDTCQCTPLINRAGSGAAQYNRQGTLKIGDIKNREREITKALETFASTKLLY